MDHLIFQINDLLFADLQKMPHGMDHDPHILLPIFFRQRRHFPCKIADQGIVCAFVVESPVFFCMCQSHFCLLLPELRLSQQPDQCGGGSGGIAHRHIQDAAVFLPVQLMERQFVRNDRQTGIQSLQKRTGKSLRFRSGKETGALCQILVHIGTVTGKCDRFSDSGFCDRIPERFQTYPVSQYIQMGIRHVFDNLCHDGDQILWSLYRIQPAAPDNTFLPDRLGRCAVLHGKHNRIRQINRFHTGSPEQLFIHPGQGDHSVCLRKDPELSGKDMGSVSTFYVEKEVAVILQDHRQAACPFQDQQIQLQVQDGDRMPDDKVDFLPPDHIL